MTMPGCRVCKAAPLEAWLVLPGMPQAAQGLPQAGALEADQPVDLVIGHCRACGTIQSASPPVPYYREVIRAVAYSPEMMEFRLRQLADFVQAHGLAGKKVLEVGAGRGEYLRLLQQVGLQAYGLEYGQASVQACLADGHHVQQLFPEAGSGAIAQGPFDAFASFNFLEHWPDPRGSLEVISRQLAPEAIGLIEVPNFDMILSKGLLTEFIADHIFYFTSGTLRTLLEISGFDVVSIQPVWYDYILSAQVRKKRPINPDGFEAMLCSMRSALHDFAARYGRVAVWGAGHQALATLALTDLAPKIRYVVDSAPFKQGRYTPATHLPIVAPDRLKEDPVDAVIVMAAAYGDEVVRQVRQEHGDTLKLGIVRDNQFEVVV